MVVVLGVLLYMKGEFRGVFFCRFKVFGCIVLIFVEVLIFLDVLSVKGFNLLILELFGVLIKFESEDIEFVVGILLEFILDSY